MNSRTEDIWWDETSGPKAFVERIVDAVDRRRIPLLRLPPCLPFRGKMESAVHEGLAMRYLGARHARVFVDAEGECPACGPADVGLFLLNRLAGARVADLYREGSGMPVQRFLLDSGALRNRFVWVRNIPSEREDDWVSFFEGLGESDLQDTAFALEVGDGYEVPSEETHCEAVDFGTLLKRRDLDDFSAAMLSGMGDPQGWVDYKAAVAARLCVYDAELSEALLRRTDWRTTSPIDMLGEIAEQEGASLCGGEENSSHALALVSRGEEEELRDRLWTAQNETLFKRMPKITDSIKRRIDGYIRESLKVYPILDRNTKKNKKAKDLDIGEIEKLMEMTGGYEESVRVQVYNFNTSRNKLAHKYLGCCTPEEVNEILSYPL